MAKIVKLQNPSNGRNMRTVARKSFLVRTRLLEELEGQHHAVMSLLHAPAGYGKTVLLQQLFNQLRREKATVCLLTLDESDRDSDMLMKRLAGALPNITAEELQDGLPEAADRQRFILLDNAERLVGSDGERVLLRFLEQRSTGVHLVVASRLLPRFNIVKWQLAGELALLDAGHLCFSLDEMAEFLAERSLKLTKPQISELVQVTGGWPVAVQVAVKACIEDGLDISRLLTGEAYAWRKLHSYVDEEIMQDFPPELRAFVLEIAPLGRITTEFATKLTGSNEVVEYFGVLEEKGLLALEDSTHLEPWYRFHSLISQFLESLLAKEHPARLIEIHKAAVAWNRENGRLSDAIRHAFAMNDTTTAAELLERASWERRRHGTPTPVGEWSDQLPDEAYNKHPLLRTEAACSFATSFALEAARTHANTVRKKFSDLEPIVRDDLFAVDAMIKIYADQPEDLVEIAERGLRDCVARDPYTLGTLHLAASIGFLARGKLDRARRAALEAKIENDRAENPFGMAVSQMLMGLVHAIEGQLPLAIEAWDRAEETIEPATKVGMVDKIAIGYRAESLYEMDKIQEAQTYIDRCLEGPVEIMLPDMVACTYVTAARIAALTSVDEAFSLLGNAEAIGLMMKWPRFHHVLEWERVRITLSAKQYDEAKRIRAKMIDKQEFVELPGIMSHAMETEASLVGELRFESLVSPNPAIISRLRAAVSQALSSGRKWRATRLMIIEAVCRKSLGDHSAALRAMRTALKYGYEGQMVRSFVDEGPIALSLVQQIRDAEDSDQLEIPRSYLDSLLTEAGGLLPQMEEEPMVIEPLSERELEILRLIFDGCSNADAARRLFVSENTIKWHLQHVYSKLGVKNRTAAVAAARILNLVG